MKSLDINIKITATYDFITFNGENVDEVISFVKKHHINGQTKNFYEVRPNDIPNLGYDDLLKWWESTGEMKLDHRQYNTTVKYNTHNSNNLPLWRKDELLHIVTKGDTCGYVNNVFMKKGDSILVVGDNFFFEPNLDESFIKDIVEEKVINNLPFNSDFDF